MTYKYRTETKTEQRIHINEGDYKITVIITEPEEGDHHLRLTFESVPYFADDTYTYTRERMKGFLKNCSTEHIVEQIDKSLPKELPIPKENQTALRNAVLSMIFEFCRKGILSLDETSTFFNECIEHVDFSNEVDVKCFLLKLKGGGNLEDLWPKEPNPTYARLLSVIEVVQEVLRDIEKKE